MSIDGDFEKLVDIAAYYRGLGLLLKLKGTILAARRVGAIAAKQYEDGFGPANQFWKRNKDGRKSLRRPIGTVKFKGGLGVIRAWAEDVMRWHDKTRPVFPRNNTLPPPWAAAADEALREVAEKSAPR
jgi:hypothetical protein